MNDKSIQPSQAELVALNGVLNQRIADLTADLARQEATVQALTQQVEQAESRERKRMSRLLHDHLQQLLAAAKLRLSMIRMAREPDTGDQTDQDLQEIGKLLTEAIQATRDLTNDPRHPPA